MKEVGRRGTLADCTVGEFNCCCICEGNITLNSEWACEGDSDSTFHAWLQLSRCACLNSLSTKYGSYLLRLICNCVSVSDCKQPSQSPWLPVKTYIPLYSFLDEFYTHLEAHSARSFQNAFHKCSRTLNIFFKYFLWMSSVFSLSSHLKIQLSLIRTSVRFHSPTEAVKQHVFGLRKTFTGGNNLNCNFHY